MSDTNQTLVSVPFISDTGATHLAGAFQWLLGMAPVDYDEEKWSLSEVVKRITEATSNAVVLVMHNDDCQDGSLRCGPLVSQAIVTCAQLGRDYCFLVPITLESRLSADAHDEVIVTLCNGVQVKQPRGIVTSDLRIVPAMLSMRAKKAQEVDAQ